MASQNNNISKNLNNEKTNKFFPNITLNNIKTIQNKVDFPNNNFDFDSLRNVKSFSKNRKTTKNSNNCSIDNKKLCRFEKANLSNNCVNYEKEKLKIGIFNKKIILILIATLNIYEKLFVYGFFF